MVDIVTRAGKGSPLTNNEVDANFTNLAEVSGITGEPMGHEDRTTSTISFNASTRTFTIAPVSTSFTVWCKGKKVVVSSAQTVTIPNTSGMYSIYFDANGALAAKAGYFTFSEEAPTAYIYWNAATGACPYFGDERHGVVLDWQTHEYLHRTRGAALASGFGASGYTLGGNGSSNAHAQLTLEGGTFFDEDMKIIVTATNTPTAGTWEQDLLSPARIPVLYLSGTGWVIDSPTDYPLKQGTARPQYNALSGGVWSTADVANNKYATSWILATNNLTYPVIAIIGQAESDLQSAAEAVDFTSLQLPGFPSVEFRPLYRLVFQCADSFSNAVKASLVSITDIRSIAAAGVAASLITDHGNLSGLSDDDHPQYLSVDTVRASLTAAVKASFLPSQTGNAGKFLTTDATSTSWAALTSGNITTALGFTPYNATNPAGYITGITSSDVTTALGFTPYNATNPSGFVTAAGARGAISVTGAGSYDSATGVINIVGGVTSFNTRTGAITLSSADVTTALGFTPYNSTNPNGYLTGITSTQVTTALGYTPYNSSNPSGYITGITSGMVTTALGFTPYNNSNPSGYITSSALSGYLTSASAASTYAPLTGTGASGTWGISITGNAATVTNGLYKVGTNAIPAAVVLNTTADNWMWQWASSGINDWYLGPTTANFGIGGSRLAISSSGSSPNAELSIERGSTRLLEILQANLQYKGNVVLHAGNYTSYAATAGHNHTYDVNNAWLRDANDDANVKLYGNTRQMVFRTDGTTEFASGVGGYAFAWMYGGDSAGERRMLLASDGRLWTNYHGWLDTMSVAYASTAGSADAIDGIGFRNTNSNAGTNADTIESNGITYYTAGVPNFSGYATDGALYSQAYSGSWQHQIAGDYRSGQIALRGKNNGSWQSWRTVLDSSNYNSYALPLSGGTLSGTLRFGDSTNGLYLSGGRLTVRSESADGVANFASYGLYLPVLSQTAGLYVESPIEARGGLRMGSGAGSGTITVGADTNATPNRLVQRDSGGDTYQRYSFAVHFNQSTSNTENPSIAAFWTNSGADNYNRKSSPAHVISQLGLLTTSNYSSYALPLSGGTMTGQLNIRGDAPTIVFQDTNHRSAMVHVNSNIFYVLRGTGTDSTSYATYNGYWPMELNLENNNASFGGSITSVGNTVLHAGNYNSYSPTLTGGGASGTWGINVTGYARQLNGYNNQTEYTILDGPANGPVIKVRYDSATANRWIDIGYKDGNGVYSEGLKIYNGGTLTWAGNTILHAGNYNSYAPTLTGGNASGTWGISITGSAASVGGLTPAQFFNNMGNNHGTYTDFNSVPGFGAYYVQAGTNSPTGTGSHQWYGFTLGLGNEYALSSYGTQIYWPRRAQNGSTYLYIRDREGGSWTSWTKVQAGYADSAGSVVSTGVTNLYSPNGATVVSCDASTAMPSVGNSLIHTLATGPSGNDGHILAMSWANTTSVYGAQLWLDTDPTNRMALRSRNSSGTWNGFWEVLTAGNYTSYSPSLTGSGASGLWGINTNGYSYFLKYDDGPRDLSNRPPNWNNRSVVFDFVGAGTGNGAGNYAGVMTFSPWDGTSASTGDSSYQLAFANQSGVNASGPAKLSIRNGINSSWNSWQEILTSSNYTSYATARTSSGRPGVYKLYRNESDDPYNIQTTWSVDASGYWSLRGYYNDSYHAACYVALSGRSNRANGNFYIDDNYGCGIVGTYASTRYQAVFAMGDSYKMSTDGTSLSNMYGIAWSHPNAGGAAGNLTDHGMLIINNGGFRCAISNSIVASGNITAYSDERLKTNWRDMPEDYVTRLAEVKVGIYDRIDETEMSQVGVSAQSFQKLLPQAIMTAKDEMQTLSVNYGSAALASAVELAKEVVDLRARVAHLESLISKLIGD